MSFKRQAAIGAYWMGTSGAIGASLQIGTLAVLARLLEPQIFGLVAMVSIVVGLTQIYADLGISNAIIHRQDTTREQLSSLYWLNILAGIVTFLLVVAATPLVVLLYDEPRLEELVPVAALTLLISPLGMQFRILLQKNLQFKYLAVSEVVGGLAGAGVAISAALAGYGPYALIFGGLANSGIVTGFVLAVAWRQWPVALVFRRRHLQGYVSFGMYQMGERTINYFVGKLDQLLIGALVGPQALGYYNLAANLVYLPIQRINPILTRVAFPLFAKVQNNNDQLKRGYMLMREFLATVNFPLFFGLAASASIFIPILYGEQWTETIILVQILSVVSLLRSTGNPVGSLLLAKGRADYGFYWNLFAVAIQIPAVATGAYLGGAVGVATTVLGTQCCFFCIGYFVLVRPLIGPCFRQYMGTLGPAAFSASIMAIAVMAIGEVAPGPATGYFIAQVLAGLAIYLALNWFVFRENTTKFAQLVLGRDAP